MVLLFLLAFCRFCSSKSGFCGASFQFECFILGLFLWPSSVSLLLLLFLFCPVFDQAPLILNASFGEFSYSFLYPALFVVLFWLAFPSVSLLLVCFSGVVHMSQPVAG